MRPTNARPACVERMSFAVMLRVVAYQVLQLTISIFCFTIWSMLIELFILYNWCLQSHFLFVLEQIV